MTSSASQQQQVDIGSNPLLRGSTEEEDSQIDQHLAFVESSGARRAHYRRTLLARAALIVTPIVILSGIIVGVSIVMTGNDKDEGKPSSTTTPPTTKTTPTGGGAHLVPPPANLEATCSVLFSSNNPTNSSGTTTTNETQAAADPAPPEDAELACRELCEPAECCHFPSTFSLSCLLGNEDLCMTYHTSCHVIEDYGSFKHTTTSSPNTTSVEGGGMVIPPAPTYLPDICSPTSLLTIDGFGECQAECDRAECCWEGGSCLSEHKEDCASYAPCLHLGATDHTTDSESNTIPTYLSQACTDLTSLEGRTHCRTACQTALCCFVAGTDGSSSSSSACPHTDDDFCSQYHVCDSLESSTEVVASKEEIQEACSQDLNTYTHVSLCEVECERGACCFTTDGCGDAAAEVDCEDTYKPCAFLYGGTEQPPPPGAATDDATLATTDDDEIDDDDDTLVVVTDDDVTDDATNPYGENDDDEQEENIDDVHMMKQQVDEACTGYTTREEAEGTDCESICEPGLCCYDGTDCGAEFSCRVYDSCEVLHGLMDDEDAIKSEVESACLGADPEEVDANWEHPCHVICEPVVCCFDEAISCEESANPNVKCELYEACDDVLFNPKKKEEEGEGETEEGESNDVDIVGFTTQDVTDKCLDNDMGCRTICGAARCCFTSDEACKPGITCSAFEECTKYFGGDTIIGEAGPTELELVEPAETTEVDERPPLPPQGMGPDDMELISMPHSPYGD